MKCFDDEIGIYVCFFFENRINRIVRIGMFFSMGLNGLVSRLGIVIVMIVEYVMISVVCVVYRCCDGVMMVVMLNVKFSVLVV